MSKERICRTEAKITNEKADKTQQQQSQVLKNAWQCYKDNEISIYTKYNSDNKNDK